ncbi:MFS transporter [Streptomyces sp. HNM0663]|uniref:MFS transporter n=1 Tax=Streptomyces chengmaiensis TaxID=3040919 RepID=A0ABT6HPQ3_9ACTN|nr:MFS transporter [Streptomyces chengmaiensis]MDH2390605.1 MFS transporter [Streptomyces chengmaiensis]
MTPPGLPPASRSPRGQTAACYAAFLPGALVIASTAAALPSMSQDLGMSHGQVQWAASSYPAVAGSLQLGATRCADRLGARTTLAAALTVFAVAALWAAASATPSSLILARAFQGVGGCVLAPVSLAVLASPAAPAARRARGVGGWVATAALANALGPLLGGLVTGWWGWRVLSLVLAAQALIAVVLCCRGIPDARNRHIGLDKTGITLCAVITGATLITLIGPAGPPDVITATCGSAFIAGAGVLLLRVESRRPHAVLDIDALRDPARRSLLISLASIFACNSGFMYYSFIYLTQLHRTAPLHASFPLLVATVPAAITARAAARRSRHGQGLAVAAIGLALMGSALLAMPFVGPPSPMWPVPYAGIGAGLGLANGAAMADVTLRAPRAMVSRATATAVTTAMLGGSLGPALSGTVIAAHALHWRHTTPSVSGDPTMQSPAVLQAASGGAPLDPRAYPHTAVAAVQRCLDQGIHWAFGVLGLLALCVALLLLKVRSRAAPAVPTLDPAAAGSSTEYPPIEREDRTRRRSETPPD